MTRNFRRNRRKRFVSLSTSSKEIPLDTSDDSFDEDNNDDFCAVYKEYFYSKKGPKRDWNQCIECNKWLREDCNDNHLH
ncbi:hypothetical protein TNIN_4911 [Trichonephila inaurata madagascariensis]|uniref:Uncharacterized protein n=1 Tax=Trichonephila inaurata madagascariensis TaxID=2747483 RepID=A0A8X7C6A1_9ARAC|nr:hypothetical protein TNIN_4911 [Trichonephila inaurata madagascariensis]